MAELKGQCHCGAVQITVPSLPKEIVQCNCSLCLKSGWTGSFWHPDSVKIDAKPEMMNSYVQGDKMITLWNCKLCGSHTHWTPRTAASDWMGVNIRMFDPAIWRNVPMREVDGASL